MAATIMFQIKNIGNNKKLSDFITIVNNFIESQEMTSIKSNIDDGIFIYFSDKNMSSTEVRNIIKVIRMTKNANLFIKTLFFTHNLSKG